MLYHSCVRMLYYWQVNCEYFVLTTEYHGVIHEVSRSKIQRLSFYLKLTFLATFPVHTQDSATIRAAPPLNLISEKGCHSNLFDRQKVEDKTCFIPGPVPLVNMFYSGTRKQVAIDA
jgi:hypothetical protein